jgi:conjugative relaxase-like TrwC/TraI family protein
VVVTLSKGYDLEYMWRQVGRAAERAGTGYYIEAAEVGGEPPGRWWGPGAEALGFSPGQVVERGPYDLLFGQRQAPDGTALGRPPSGAATAADLYAQLLAAEPHATAERRRELRSEAAGRVRQSPLYFDLTISLSKSISVFHASLGENARLARQAGDAEGAAYWDGLVAEAEDMIWQAVHAGFAYFQREAGYTRTGSHARRAGGRESGQWREAELAVAHWLQHTSRDGDMQLHVHSQIAHVARTVHDGKWRAPDSYGYAEHLGAVEAIVSQHLEEALTAWFGVDWASRDDGHGFEIAGITGRVLRVFSSRRESITADVRERARVFAARYGREPSQRELARLAQASNFSTRARKDAHAHDKDAAHAGWAQRLDAAAGIRLASVAPSVWGERRPQALDTAAARRAALKALVLAQQDRSTFTRADVVKHLGRVLPRTGMDPGAGAALLEDLADRVLAGEFGAVACLEAPEPAPVPVSLTRADGRSVYRRHGGVRYATAGHLAVEERMAAQAQASGAPAIAPGEAGWLLGASAAQLGAALASGAHDAGAGVTPAGLRTDQAAVVLAVLSDGRRVSVINAPAGSGKTRVLAAAGRAWTLAGKGRVVGVAPSQSARNTLAAAGITEAYNTAQFLGHLPGRPGALGTVPLRPGDLVAVDEASMITTADLAAVIGHAAQAGAKVVLAGDTSQLQAVESGGGMSLLAETLGYVRLAEPVRFAQEWERAASLRLRAGDASVLAEYDQHGRISGGGAEEMMDAAARDYVALTLDGTDVLLMAADHARRRELSRRIREDLIALGLVAAGPAAAIGSGEQASAGDLVVCTRNDHQAPAGEPGRTIANGDLLKIEAVTRRGLVVRRALDADPQTGARRWTDRSFLYADLAQCELGYAVTIHAAQSRTVDTGLGLFAGTEDLQHLYVALTRGWRANHAYVLTSQDRAADPAPGPRPAPELARFDRLVSRRESCPASGTEHADADPAIGVLAVIAGRDGRELSAVQVREHSLSDADHLAVLHGIWADQAAQARHQRYRTLLHDVLPPQYRGQDSHRERWLSRTLHAAELAGRDPAVLLAEAVAGRSLADAHDIAAVVDARIRRATRGLVPTPARSWAEQVPRAADPARQAYLDQLARLMDDRTQRIGEHVAQHPPSWILAALGPVPADPDGRARWQQRASIIGAYREMHGYQHPADPIGPEPPAAMPDQRAAWHHALASLALPGDANGVRGLPDAALWHVRDTYQADTAWAPPWPGDQLRQARRVARDAGLATTRARGHAAAARKAGREAEAARHEELAGSYRAIAAAYRQREDAFAAVMDDRRAWDQATAARRRAAIAADSELRRRHPGKTMQPLRSAEPEPAAPAAALVPGKPIPDISGQIKDLAAGRADFARQFAAWLNQTTENRTGLADLTASWLSPAGSDGGPLLHPPMPPIQPSKQVLERVRERQAGIEATS